MDNYEKLIGIDDLLEETKKNDPESYKRIMNNVEKRAEEFKKRGGKRVGAGRPKVFENRKTITKKLPESVIIKLKDYSKAHNMSENEALDKLITAGYEYLEKDRA